MLLWRVHLRKPRRLTFFAGIEFVPQDRSSFLQKLSSSHRIRVHFYRNELKICEPNLISVETNSNPVPANSVSVSRTWFLWKKVSLCGFRNIWSPTCETIFITKPESLNFGFHKTFSFIPNRLNSKITKVTYQVYIFSRIKTFQYLCLWWKVEYQNMCHWIFLFPIIIIMTDQTWNC